MPFDLRAGSLIAALCASAEGQSGVTYAKSADLGDRVDYATLLDRARRAAWHLIDAGVRPGDEVMLVSDDLAAFTVGFWGCLIAQAPAVPVSVPTTPAHGLKLLKVAQRLERPWLLTDADLTGPLTEATGQNEQAQALVAALLDRSLPLAATYQSPPADLPDVVPEDVAFLQFSSGSTGSPKGVTVSHGNLLANTTAIKRWMGSVETEERLVSWMPLTHDFGIIFFHILPVVFGCEHVLLPTRLFMRNPIAWMDWVNRVRATATGAPNYAYRHFLKRFDPGSPRGWDLSCLKVICNGAEPISLPLANAFSTALAPVGLPPTAMSPAYGLAEGTLVTTACPVEQPISAVSVDRRSVGEGATVVEADGLDAVQFADCGFPLHNVRLRIGDPDGLPLPDRVVGRVQIAGPCVTRGYWRDEGVTRTAFTADGYLDTGDLGFVVHGRLYLTGRRKDLIILDGVNYYPQDIEAVASEVEGLDLNMVVACSVPHPSGEREALGLFVQHRKGLQAFAPVAQAVRDHVLASVGVAVDVCVPISRVPKTTSGKVQRFELVERYKAGSFNDAMAALDQLARAPADAALDAFAASDAVALTAALVALVATLRPDGSIQGTTVLRDAGLTSQQLIALQARIGGALQIELPATALFDHPNLASLADALVSGAFDIAHRGFSASSSPDRGAVPIGISGVGLRLPGGVTTLEELSTLLTTQQDAVTSPPVDRWPDGFGQGLATDRCGWLEDIEPFDAKLFRLTPAEAEAMDPQQRFLLTTVWEALEDAGLPLDQLTGSRTGVFVGLSNTDYDQIHRTHGAAGIGQYGYTGGSPAVAAGRIAYSLGTRGPAISLDTACSSGLVALVEAMQAIRAGRCDRAIVAAANLILTEEMHGALTQMQALSPLGVSRSFDDAADGYCRGEGAIALVLEAANRSDTAAAAPFRALLRGGAVNHDGASNGLTAPNRVAQAEVMRDALADAGVAADTVDAVEAHGTGTPLGDPIEVGALATVYGARRDAGRGPLPVTAIKSAIGHLEAAAGLAGLAKALVMLDRGEVLPCLHLSTPNTRVDWAAERVTPVQVAHPLSPPDDRAARIGVSAFGMSGTNAHVIVEGMTAAPIPVTRSTVPVLLAISAGSEATFAATTERWAAAVRDEPASLADLALTASAGRQLRPIRGAIVAAKGADAAAAVSALVPHRVEGDQPPPVVALFSGQGSQAAGVASALADRYPVFAENLARSDAAAAPILGQSLTDLLSHGDAATLSQTAVTQPAIVAVGLALSALFRTWGIEPAIALGHSVGELAAAASLGLVDPDSAVAFAAARGQAMQAHADTGAMLAIALTPAAAQSALADRDPALSVAAINGPNSVTVGGPTAAIDELEASMRTRGVRVKRLEVSHAFHGPMMEPALPAIRDAATRLRRGPGASGTVISAVSGRRIEPQALIDPDYWVAHAREPVRWADALQAVPEQTGMVAIDIGARPVSLASVGAARADLMCWPAVDRNDPVAGPLIVAGALWERGVPVDLTRTFDGVPARQCHAPKTVLEGRVPVMGLPAPVAATKVPTRGESRQASTEVNQAQTVLVRAQAEAEVTRSGILRILKGIAGLNPDDVRGSATWFSLGLDSLLIVQLQQGVNRAFDLTLTLADMHERGETLDQLTELVAAQRPQPALSPSAELSIDPSPRHPTTESASSADVATLMTRQIDAMQSLFAQQLAVLQGQEVLTEARQPVRATPEQAPQAPALSVQAKAPSRPTAEIKGLFRQPSSAAPALTKTQRSHVNRLAAEWNARSATSKAQMAEDRAVLANPRAIIGFRPEWKELTYPLHVDRAAGPHVWDIDGHRYVDITMGFGATLRGHNPPDVRQAVADALARGAPIGPQSPVAGAVARGIARLTGVERVAFFTTGTEAVMVAVRLARAVTGRPKIVLFTDSYHGTFDGVLAVGWGDRAGTTTLPVTDGTPDGMVGDVIVLRYGDDEALETIRAHGERIAAVLVEPVQSRNPTLQPADFLHTLRTVTSQVGSALIFDEIITGFRIAPGGAQAHFGIQADMVTYGKVIGGGQPIGVVAGKRRFLDAVDGGAWAYGDDSLPTTRTAFVAGTFNAHPLAMAAAAAMLTWLEREGPDALTALNARTEALCQRLDALFTTKGAPITMARFGSLFRFDAAAGLEALNYHLLLRGVFVWEGRNCFLSTAHTDDDLDTLVAAVEDGVDALAASGWFARKPALAVSGKDRMDAPGSAAAATSALSNPVLMTRGQKELWVLNQTRPAAATAYYEAVLLSVAGDVSSDRVTEALNHVVDRHPMLRAGGFDGTHWLRDHARPTLSLWEGPLDEHGLNERLAAFVARPFDLDTGPVLRVALHRSEAQRGTVLALVAHHIATDGWSLGLVAGELAALILDRNASLPAPVDPARFAAWASSQKAAEREDTRDLAPLPNLPLVDPIKGPARFEGTRLHVSERVADGVFGQAKAAAQAWGISPVAVLLAGYACLVARLTGQAQFRVGIPVAGHVEAGMPSLVGMASTVTALRLSVGEDQGFRTVAEGCQSALGTLRSGGASLFADNTEPPAITALFNVDRGLRLTLGADRPARWISAPIAATKLQLFLNILELNDRAEWELDVSAATADRDTGRAWLTWMRAHLAAGLAAPDTPVRDLMAEAVRPGPLRVRDGAGKMALPGVLGLVEQHSESGWQETERFGVARPDGTVIDLGGFARFDKDGPRLVDRQSQAPSAHPSRYRVAPRTPTEAAIAALWASTLGRTAIGVTDNFFDLGGSSLKAVAILAQLRADQGHAPSLAAFIAEPTVSGIARALAEATPSQPIPRLPDAPDYPAGAAQARLWFLDQRTPGLAAYNIPFRLDTTTTLQPSIISATLAALADRHESLRTALVEIDGLPRQRVFPRVEADLRVHPLPGKSDVDALAEALAMEPFDLGQAPLWRAGLFQHPQGTCLVISIHHAVADVWSIEVLVRDFLSLLRVASDRTVPQLVPLPIQYRDAAAQEHGRKTDGAAQAYWRTALADPPPPLNLPGAAPRPLTQQHRGRVFHRSLSAEASAALKARAIAGHGSVFAATLGVLAETLCRETGRPDLILATVVAGRDHPDLTDQVGFFVNTVPIRLRVGAAWIDPVSQAAQGLGDAIAHIGLSFDQIVEAAAIPWRPGRTPLCDVMVVLDEREGLEAIATAEGFTVAEIDTPTSQFDLTIYVTERPKGLDLKLVVDADLFGEAAAKGLVDLLVRGLSGGHSPTTAPPSIDPASPHTARLWFVDQFENGKLYPAGPTYYTQALSVPIDPAPAPETIRRALVRLTDHHPILRARLLPQDGQPVVEIAAESPPVPFQTERGAAGPVIEQSIAVPFELDKAPLVRALLIEGDAGSQSAKLVLVGHHAFTDPNRLACLLQDLRTLIGDADAVLSRPINPDIPTQGLAPEIAAWWQNRLAGLQALVLPTDRPRPAVHTFTTGCLGTPLPDMTAGRLKTHAAAWGVTETDVIRAAYQAWLARLSGQTDIILGEPVAPADPAASIANLVPSRLTVDPNSGFEALVRASAAARTEDIAHGKAPFDAIVLAVKPKNDMSRTALFDVMLITDPPADVDVSGFGWGKYDLTLTFSAASDAGELVLVYNRDLFEPESAATLLDRFLVLLDRALKSPAQPLGAVPLWLPDERDPVIARATTGLARYPMAETLHGRFEAVAQIRGEATAIVAPDATLSYIGLNLWAEQIAHRLLAHGVGAGDRVGLLLDRTAALAAAMVGVLKAGGGYVPIDIDYPADRQQFMATDASITAIITDRAQSVRAQSLSATVILVDQALTSPADPSPSTPVSDRAGSPRDLAYVIYTSGSTGRPKGVMVTHGNVIQLLFSEGMPVTGGSDDVWSLFHSPCFDFSVWELYGALLTGGKVVVVDRDTARDTVAFHRLLAEQKVTLLSQTPSAFYTLAEVDAEVESRPLAVRTVVFGGEALHPARLALWHARHPDVRLVNMYGITETTVHVTWSEIGSSAIADGRSVIGQPLPSYGVVILGPDGALLPPGLIGEIGVTGPGVSQGYLGQPELTADRFIDHPDLPATRLYRSGDLGRIGPDGALVYLGRIDAQVKIRGFRIELGEIERGLEGLPGIQAAVVAAAGTDQLVAFLTIAPNTEVPDRDRLLAELSEHLPDYMIPGRLVVVDRIPLTGNGKADRKRLLAEGGLDLTGTGSVGRAEAGRNRGDLSPTAAALSTLWAEVLGLPTPPGAEANFFDLGGHSLLASRVVGRVRSRLGRKIDLKSFFAAPTLASLAAVVEQAPSADAEVAVRKAATEVGASDKAPLSYPQRRLWLLQSKNPRTTAYNMVGAMELIGPLDPDAMARGLEALIHRHAILRTRYVMEAGAPTQVILPAEQARVCLRQVSNADQAMADAVLAAEFRYPFDLAHDPPIRSTLVQFAAPAADGRARNWLVMNLHHIASDGWSVTVMLRDWAAFTRAAMSVPAEVCADSLQRTTDLPVLASDYAAFARKQQTDVPQQMEAEAYWRQRLRTWPEPLDLPTDYPRSAATGHAGAMVYRTLSQEASTKLRGLARAHGTTLFTVLAAVVAVQLHKETGADDLPFGTPVAGRQDEALENQIGFYLNLLPLRARVGDAMTYAGLIDQMADATAGALAYQTYPFDRVIEVADPPRVPGRHPLFDVLLILQNNAPPRFPLPGVEDRMLRDSTVSAKLDLNYMIEDRPALELALEVATDLYTMETAEQLADGFVAIAQALIAAPETVIRSAQAAANTRGSAISTVGGVAGLLDDDAW